MQPEERKINEVLASLDGVQCQGNTAYYLSYANLNCKGIACYTVVIGRGSGSERYFLCRSCLKEFSNNNLNLCNVVEGQELLQDL